MLTSGERGEYRSSTFREEDKLRVARWRGGHRVGSLGAYCVVTILLAATVQGQQVKPSERVIKWVNVRASGTTGSEIVGRLEPSEIASLLETLNHWYRVQLADGTKGFVSRAWTVLAPGVVSPPDFTVHFLDVGTGDAALIDVGVNEILIDGGNWPDDVRAYIQSRSLIDGPLELLIITHADSDHWKGLPRLLGLDGQNTAPTRVLEVWDAGYDRRCKAPGDPATASYLAFIAGLRNLSGTTLLRPLADHHPPAIQIGMPSPFTLASLPGVTFTVLNSSAAPDSVNGECSYLINNASIVLLLEIGGHRLLFTGDANGKERAENSPGTPGHIEALLLALEQNHPGLLKAEVLKVPHHGSETASTQRFIDAVGPAFAVISASTTHHLPRDSVLLRYAHPARVILRTDRSHARAEDHIICSPSATNEMSCDYSN